MNIKWGKFNDFQLEALLSFFSRQLHMNKKLTTNRRRRLQRTQRVIHSTSSKQVAILFIICNAICENLPYGETNNVLIDQQFSHVCDSIFGQKCTESDKNVCCRCLRATKSRMHRL